MSPVTLRALIRRFHEREAGGAMVELAVVLPLLLVIAIGVMDYGRVFATSVTVANAARAGAEYGTANLGNYLDQTAIQNFAKLDAAEAGTVTVSSRTFYVCGTTESTSPSCGGAAPEVYVEVTASKVVSLIMRYPGIPPSITVSRMATFRYQ